MLYGQGGCGRGTGQECHFVSGVLESFLYKIIDKNLKPGIPCPLKCLA